MQLFLTSSVHAVAHDIAKRVDLSKHDKLVFITTGAEPVEGDMTWFKNDKQSLVDAGFSATDYTITDKTAEDVESKLSKYDYIYMSGGDTPYLLEKSKKSGFIPIIQDFIRKQNKIYIGTSAGSIITGPVVPEYLFEDGEISEPEQRKGYGFVNFTVVPHWGREDFKDRYLNRRLKMVYRTEQNPLVILTDNQYVYVQDDCCKIIDVTEEIDN